MTNDPHDQSSDSELEQDLEAVRSAWSRQERAEPPDLLDQAVLNTARRELDGQRKRRPWRWMSAFATATVAVLALTIVVQQDEQVPAPVVEKADGLRLELPASPSRNQETDRDDFEEQAGPARATSQLGSQKENLEESKMKRSAPAPVATASDAAIVAEEMSDALSVPETEADRLPEAEAWIQQLLHLHETGQSEQLAAGLAAFREAYPDHPLPPELE